MLVSRIAVACLVAVVFAVAGCESPQPVSPPTAGGSGAGGGVASRPSAAAFSRYAVAADHPAASAAGAEILGQGGNAIDAAVATGLTLSVVRPYSAGIGGGGFMVIRLAEPRPAYPEARREFAIDYREVAPASAAPGMFAGDDPEASRFGGRAVAVPGTVAGLLYAHQKFGRLSREAVIAPAIAAAERGFVVDEHYARSVAPLVERFLASPEWQERYPLVWKKFLREGRVAVGDRIVNREQAEALRLIARFGTDAFYQGPIAARIIEAVGRAGGSIAFPDLRGYAPEETVPLAAEVQGLTFLGMPPPSSGGVTMFEALRIMDAAGIRLTDRTLPGDTQDITPAYAPENERPRGGGGGVDGNAAVAARLAARDHVFAEALKHAFADRAQHLADPRFTDLPLDRLLSPEYAGELARAIDMRRTFAPGHYGEAPLPVSDAGTSHFSIVDAEGNAVACTETINTVFGSLVGVDQFGFVLNNQMDDFTARADEPNAFGLVQSEANLPGAGKRPLSSMSPTIVVDADGGLLAVAGASGGPRIITSTLQVLLRMIAGADAAAAVAHPRVHHQWMPETMLHEAAYPPAVLEGLAERGHALEAADEIGNVQAILIRGNRIQAASDPRKGGAPAGE